MGNVIAEMLSVSVMEQVNFRFTAVTFSQFIDDIIKNVKDRSLETIYVYTNSAYSK